MRRQNRWVGVVDLWGLGILYLISLCQLLLSVLLLLKSLRRFWVLFILLRAYDNCTYFKINK